MESLKTYKQFLKGTSKHYTFKEGYLSKQAYDGKREYANRKMELNKDKGLENGLTEEQCDALSALCSARHDLHSNMDKIVRSDEYGYEYEDVPEDENERKDWFDDNYERIYDELSRLNNEIENYLKSIDLNYNTNCCPTGASRIF